ncbi:quinone oxidoreductase family protein [Paucilactobacillus hokkaidonensis]|uniref:quinone oxidoreductase family protein n=1 Tax=Paucilactobacillus hokkaidonensis TaxID=1193095 RepID=UPI0020923049|nr:zinc-binding alcohol dehydrogenase family protein [Paucilactobacillus hokkaidonensis]
MADGRLAYFVTSNPIYGSLAEQTVVDHRRIIPLPSDIDVNSVAASMNPAMSSWMALKSRLGTDINSKKIMILGATGNSGSLAVEISHYLGAKSVVAIGRNRDKLAKLTAEKTISLLDEPAKLKQEIKEVADVDVVLDYLWGDAAKQVMLALLPARSNHSQSLTWIEIGSMAGADLVLPSAALRSINLNLIGSGQGSIDPKLFLTELPALAQLISQGKFNVDVEAVPLDQVTSKWNLKTDRRLVFNP